MTREQAIKNGFQYEGRMGIVPVYLTSPSLYPGDVNAGVRGNSVWEYVLDAQDLIVDAIMFFNPKFKVPIKYERRIDGGEMPANEADL